MHADAVQNNRRRAHDYRTAGAYGIAEAYSLGSGSRSRSSGERRRDRLFGVHRAGRRGRDRSSMGKRNVSPGGRG